MLTITNGNKSEPILESDYEKFEELNGALQITFNSFSFSENHGHDLIDFEVTVEDEDGHVYKIKQLNGDRLQKRIVAVHEYFDLADHYQYELYGGTHTFDEFMTYVLNGTGWTFENEDITESLLIENFGNGNVITLINQLLKAFECERQILPNKVIRFAKSIGKDDDLQFRYKHNIETLSYYVDTTSLKTQIKGFGAEGLEVTYTSPLADNPRIGVKVTEPIRDERFSIAESLLTHLKQSLNDAPQTSIEVNVTTVDGNVGDLVWLIHEPLNYEYQTKILSKSTKRNYESSSVTIGNSKKKEITDLLVNQKVTIDQNNKQTNSRIDQTNEEVGIVVTRVGDAEASIRVNADNIELKVSKDGVIGAINVTPEVVGISAQRIEFYGHIFGEGATFSGNIQTLQNIMVGNNLYLGNVQDRANIKKIYFNDNASIEGGGGPFFSDMRLVARTVNFSSGTTIDFTGTTVNGLNLTAKFG